MKKALLLLLSAALMVGMAYAGDYSNPNQPFTTYKFSGTELDPAPEAGVPANTPVNTDDPVGDIFVMGNTWYDIQHNSTCGHYIQVDNEGYVQLVWMNGLQSGATDRHIYYQVLDPNDNILFPGGGVPVDQQPRAGYTTLAVSPEGRAFPCFHQGPGGTVPFHTALAYDYFPRSGAFAAVEGDRKSVV